jgi:DNA polymerase III epsilon subunit-like protein
MTVTEIVEKINEKPYLMRMGALKVATYLKSLPEDVREAKRILHNKGFLFKETIKTNPHIVPKILLLDIETSPLLVFVYQKQVWKANIQHDKVVSDWFILTFSCKWLGDDTIISDKLTSTEAINEDDSRLIRKLWYILSDADIVIAHNGDNFDIPNINSRFVLNGLGPTTYYKQIDTLKIAQRNFGFTHNNLDALAGVFGIPAKIETTFELWKRCISGDSKALGEMEFYNRHDVEILEQVYLRLRPWIKSHANLSLYTNSMEKECPHCGSKKLELIPDKYYYTHTGRYPLSRCLNCGATPRDRKSTLPKEKSILVSIPGR